MRARLFEMTQEEADNLGKIADELRPMLNDFLFAFMEGCINKANLPPVVAASAATRQLLGCAIKAMLCSSEIDSDETTVEERDEIISEVHKLFAGKVSEIIDRVRANRSSMN